MPAQMGAGGIVQIQYVDLAGYLRGVEVSYRGSLEASFDGSSVRGFTRIEDSDLLLRGEPETLRRIPWVENYYRVLAAVYKASGERYGRDPRYIAEKVERYSLEDLGYSPLVGVEVEFHLLDSLEVENYSLLGGVGYRVTSAEHPWETNAVGSSKTSYHSTGPLDRTLQYRLLLINYMREVGYGSVEVTHHEAAIAQVEADLEAGPPLKSGDNAVTVKWLARVIAEREGKIALFMPKPVYGDNGNGLHLHMSLWRDDSNAFADGGGGLTGLARSFIAGILEHAESLAAIVAPTTNSYRRLVPGYEAPIYVCWGHRNRTAMIRVPAYTGERKARIEYRTPDPSSNPYLAISATLMAGLDGVRRRLDPGDPLERNAYKLTPAERRSMGVRTLPRSLDEALDALESDNEYLKPVFDRDVIEAYIEMKREEAETMRGIPHPYEFTLYAGL